jgi:hypothetical protein
MQNSVWTQRNLFIISAILIGAFTRLIPHPAGLSAIGALTMFGGAYLSNRLLAIFIPVISTFVSDVVLNNTLYAPFFKTFTFFYSGAEWVYGAIIAMSMLNIVLLKRVNTNSFFLSALLTTILFFLVSNFGVWYSQIIPYPLTLGGLLSCYAAGLEHAMTSFLGNLIYGGALFGGFHLAAKRFPKLVLSR